MRKYLHISKNSVTHIDIPLNDFLIEVLFLPLGEITPRFVCTFTGTE